MQFAFAIKNALMTSRSALGVVAFLLLLNSLTAIAQPAFPELTGRVVDQASLLSSTNIEELQARLSAHEAQTTQQIVIVTLTSLQGSTIEEYGYQLGRYWEIGQKNTDNGVLLIVAPNERQVRIEVGYGLEGVLTDASSHQIIQQEILPAFRKSDYQRGIMTGIDSILAVVTGDKVYAAPTPESDFVNEIPFNSLVVLLIVCVIFGKVVAVRLKKRNGLVAFTGGILGGAICFLITSSFIVAGVLAAVAWLMILSEGGSGSGTGGGWSRGGSGSSSGGGGGSFGGGGASGGW